MVQSDLPEELIAKHASKLYNLDGDDILQFEYWSNSLDMHYDSVVDMFDTSAFILSPVLTPTAPFRFVKIATRDFRVVERLIKHHDMMIDDLNDSVMRIVLSNFSHHDQRELLFKFIKLGTFH